MQLRSVHLVNYRCFRDLQVEFQPGFNVLAGVNGSGKTSLLRGVGDALTLFASSAELPREGYEFKPQARTQIVEVAGRLRFEQQYPVKIFASVDALDLNFQLWATVELNGLRSSGSTSPRGPIWKQSGSGQATGRNQLETTLPILAFYRAHRHWIHAQPSELMAATQRHSRADAYTSWWDGSLDVVSLQTWVISKCLERLQASSETGLAPDKITDELATVNSALAMGISNAKGLHYDFKQKALVLEWSDANGQSRDSTAFEHLSDGQSSMVGLFADIARRMCLLNPQLGSRVIAETPGVVLIDELDIHLHPRWQRDVVTGLQRAFPQVQFITASHSPLVLGELQPEQIILLRPEGTSHPQASYGLDSSQVLEEIMGAEPRAAEVEQALSEVFALLERMQLDSARSKLGELKRLAPGIPELAGAEALLKRKEVLGR